MEVKNTVWPSKKKESRPFTGVAFLGRRFEVCGLAHCRRRRYQVLKRNLELKGGEIDILAWDASLKSYVLIEVRGRTSGDFLPSMTLPIAKQIKLERLARRLLKKGKKPLRIEFIEVRGNLNWPRWAEPFLRFALKRRPEWFGFRLRAYRFTPFL